MKLNIAHPATGHMKVIDVDDEKKLRAFFDKRMGAEIDGGVLGPDFEGFIFRISGGNDKQGFPMMQGVMSHRRVRLLLTKDSACYRPRRKGERKRKSVRGCIVGPDLAVLNLVVVKQGPSELPGLTDNPVPRRLGPKRASKIRKLFNLTKDDDVRKFVVAREFKNKKGKDVRKRPAIQRLVTPVVLQRKRRRAVLKKVQQEKVKAEAAEYARVHAAFNRERRASRRSSRRSSKKE
eukprot:CAMPEP_0203807152 /NCGR_PEP_ID=MMETSP0115-20131106/901_1 /ASSEMBLY_ACC=CAM_ASM_000227 /TAXON_ID=33651 /ORGANISM="Bicosoecid sp, Strain ms1" /LENGTH=234 /DNA_ID=CAMNT_0050715823 /DNA_START=57 /DNA_END=761 /DNA_ORIENTATION=-